MSDLIERSDVIDALKPIAESLSYGLQSDIASALMSIPTIEPKRGRWVDISEWYTPRQKCSVCETVVDGYGSNFCPNCGAEMRGEGNE